jgi:hypothetical protein
VNGRLPVPANAKTLNRHNFPAAGASLAKARRFNVVSDSRKSSHLNSNQGRYFGDDEEDPYDQDLGALRSP